MLFLNFNLSQMIVWAVTFFIAITVHEFAHGWAAYKLGDDTAERYGRLTLNPLKHIDLMGLLMLLFAGIGWAKPVPVNPYNLRNPKTDMALISAAGPAANFALAILLAILIRFILFPMNLVSLGAFLVLGIQLNIMLGLFNLVPIPPLDGSKILGSLLPDNLYYHWTNLERYGPILIIILVFSGRSGNFSIFQKLVLEPAMRFTAFLLGG